MNESSGLSLVVQSDLERPWIKERWSKAFEQYACFYENGPKT